jgi:hypothetical protein
VTGATGVATLAATKFVPVVSLTTITTGVGGVSLIGGPFSVVVNAGDKLAIIASAQVAGGTNTSPEDIEGMLVIDGSSVAQEPTVQVPVALSLGLDGSMLTIVWETTGLTAGSHTVDFQASTSAPDNCIATTGAVFVMRVTV